LRIVRSTQADRRALQPEPDGGNEGGPAGRDRASSRCSREAARRQPIHYRRQIYGGRRLSVHGAQLDQYHQIDLAKWPNIKAYMARIGARPKVQETMRAEGLLG